MRTMFFFSTRRLPLTIKLTPTGASWPSSGEIDMVEGVNNYTNNQVTLHTNPGCTMSSSDPTTLGISGTLVGTTDCAVATTSNAGCGVRAPGANSFGAAFNGAGGGWYAMERTNAFVKVWFWSRGAGNVPSEVRNGATTINTGNWVCIV